MKNILILIAAVAFFAGSAPAKTPEPVNSAPLGAEVEEYPFFRQGKLTPAYAASMGLRIEKLKRPTLVHNHFRQDGSWRLQTLPVGDEVWVKKATGALLYRVACSNRIMAAPYAEVTSTFSPLGYSGISSTGRNPSLFDRLVDGLVSGWNTAMNMLGSMLDWLLPLLPLLLFLVLLALAGYGLYHLFQRRQAAQPQAPPVVAPPVTSRTDRPTILPTGEFVRSRSVASPAAFQAELTDNELRPAEQVKPKVSEKPEVSVGEFKILRSGKGKPTAYVISGCIMGFEKRPDGSFLIREAE